MFCIDPDDLLILACESNNGAIVEHLLKNHQCNPNYKDTSGRTPLSVTSDAKVIQLLLRNGAVAESSYVQRKPLRNFFSKDVLKKPVKVFVIGDGGQGKSTLIKALQYEPSMLENLTSYFIAPDEVSGVSQQTVGIVPQTFESKVYGDVQFFDFAGQETFYSSHAAVIKMAIDISPPIFILVLGTHKDDKTVTDSVSYWLGIVSNQCTSMDGKAPLIVIGSHADTMLNKKEELQHKRGLIFRSTQSFKNFDVIAFIPMDCRYSNSDGMKLLRRTIRATCANIREKLTIGLSAHAFLNFIMENHTETVAISLKDAQNEVAKAAMRSKRFGVSADTDKILSIPTNTKPLLEICRQLSDKGHILLLYNNHYPEKSFIILNKGVLIAEVNGTIFSPSSFKEHCQLASSTGVVTQSALASRFPKLHIDILVGFLVQLELAVPIEDPEILCLIRKQLCSEMRERYFFFPALIRIEAPEEIWDSTSHYDFFIGWSLSCTDNTQFFDARFLHVLLLRLSLSLGLAPVIDPNLPSLQRQCSVWKSGICWSTVQGTKVVVQIISKRTVSLVLKGKELSSDFVCLRTSIVQKVLEAASQFCPLTITSELLLTTSELKCGCWNAVPKTPYSLKSVAQSIVGNHPFVVSKMGAQTVLVSEILPVQVYANLGENNLQRLFNNSDPTYDQLVSDSFISVVASCWSTSSHLSHIIQSIVAKTEYPKNCQSAIYQDELQVTLTTWRDGCTGSYRLLRNLLDKYSIFAGRNPLVCF